MIKFKRLQSTFWNWYFLRIEMLKTSTYIYMGYLSLNERCFCLVTSLHCQTVFDLRLARLMRWHFRMIQAAKYLSLKLEQFVIRSWPFWIAWNSWSHGCVKVGKQWYTWETSRLQGRKVMVRSGGQRLSLFALLLLLTIHMWSRRNSRHTLYIIFLTADK